MEDHADQYRQYGFAGSSQREAPRVGARTTDSQGSGRGYLLQRSVPRDDVLLALHFPLILIVLFVFAPCLSSAMTAMTPESDLCSVGFSRLPRPTEPPWPGPTICASAFTGALGSPRKLTAVSAGATLSWTMARAWNSSLSSGKQGENRDMSKDPQIKVASVAACIGTAASLTCPLERLTAQRRRR